MSDGAASLMAMFYGFKASGMWSDERRANLLDGGAHFYDTYRCADGEWISIGSIEPQFYALLLEKTGISDPEFHAQMDRSKWPDLRERLAAVIEKKTRDEWCAIMDGTDVCFAPVLDLDEAPLHPHNVARETFVNLDGVVQPAPAPRFSLTPGKVAGPPPAIGGAHRGCAARLGPERGGNRDGSFPPDRCSSAVQRLDVISSPIGGSQHFPVPRSGGSPVRRTSWRRTVPPNGAPRLRSPEASAPRRSAAPSVSDVSRISTPAAAAKCGTSIRAMGSSQSSLSRTPGGDSARARRSLSVGVGQRWPRASITRMSSAGGMALVITTSAG